MALPLLSPPPDRLLSRRAVATTSSAIRDILEVANRADVVSLAGGLPAPEAFPLAELAEAAAEALASGAAAVQYGATRGEPACRAALATWTNVPVDADDVLVTTGSQQALDLLARCLVDPGDPVVVGDPDYLGALQVLRAADARLVAVAVDGDGLRTDLLADRLAGGLRPKLVYLVPNFHNPTGVTLTGERRHHLVALAERYGFVIVEDDPYGELWFGSPPPPPLGAGSDLVVRLRSTSKTIAPGLRLGWLTGPRWVLDAVERAKQSIDLHTSSLSQAMVTGLAARPGWREPHLGRVRDLYRVRRDALVDALRDVLAGGPGTCGPAAGVTPVAAPRGGMFLWVDLGDGVDAAALLPAAVRAGVAYVPGSAFAVATPRPGALRLSYATATPAELGAAASRLAGVIASATASPGGSVGATSPDAG